MVRVLHINNYGVYVADERGERHSSPHAHVKCRGRRIASIHLLSLEMLNQIEPVPTEVMDMIQANQENLIAKWEQLNS
jgi:hypothetical protein